MKTRTPKQIEASRANGARSFGPRTEAGKRRSAANSLTHGMLADTIVFAGESEVRFHALHRALLGSLSPRNPLEEILIAKMTVAHWRQMRMWELDRASMAKPVLPELAPAELNPDLGKPDLAGGDVAGSNLAHADLADSDPSAPASSENTPAFVPYSRYESSAIAGPACEAQNLISRAESGCPIADYENRYDRQFCRALSSLLNLRSTEQSVFGETNLGSETNDDT